MMNNALTWLCYSWPSFAVDILGMRITIWWTMLWHGFAIHDPLLLLTSLTWELLYDEQCFDMVLLFMTLFCCWHPWHENYSMINNALTWLCYSWPSFAVDILGMMNNVLTWLCYSWPSFAVDILGMRITIWWTMIWHGFAIHDPLLLLTSLAWELLYVEQCNQVE